MNYETYLKQLINNIEKAPHPHTRQDMVILNHLKAELQSLLMKKGVVHG